MGGTDPPVDSLPLAYSLNLILAVKMFRFQCSSDEENKDVADALQTNGSGGSKGREAHFSLLFYDSFLFCTITGVKPFETTLIKVN